MIKVLDRTHDNCIGIEVTGAITMEYLKQSEAEFEALFAKYGTLRLLCIWRGPTYETLPAFYEDAKWMLQHAKKFERMAIVGDAWWKKLLIKADSLIFGEKYFDMADLEDAWKYLEE